ncbi:TatD family hydrolase [Frigoriflavimonas asaccharolytica]|uniref:TatD DNase family protein n=1 Tax=Frigoriflavimonas asaccharolytica TaxID=2735899 RepID=A0A8J8GCT3_9FLAO|nr:TatD family hydrolase [Frigoriflavimonas asaccharolytica]NRS93367.1 TatD DNase family protein [Frigoriflavimonas asaccharolytica]
MTYFDFHHHHINTKNGIYNIPLFGNAVDFPFSAGLHPKDISSNNDEAFLWLEEITKNINCFAIGECGLDGLVEIDLEIQKKIFQKHIVIANSLKKPIIIHCVRKHYDLIPFRKIAKTPLIMHGFNKNTAVADALLKEDFLLSFGKAVLHNVSLQEIVKNIPKEKYFLETDDADFDIENLYEKIAEIRSESLKTIKNQINKNLEFIING